MHKILLAILLFLVFLLPQSDAMALHARLCGGRTDIETTGITVAAPFNANCPNEAVCYKTISATQAECFKRKGAAPAAGAPGVATPAAVTCAPGSPDCTKGGGQRCNAGTGAVVPSGDGIYTAIGCIPTEPKAFVEGLLKYGTLAAGGIAFLLMIFGAIGMITAEGNPEAIKHSQERFYSAIIGLLVIIFSVLLIQVIGVDILGLPGFGRL